MKNHVWFIYLFHVWFIHNQLLWFPYLYHTLGAKGDILTCTCIQWYRKWYHQWYTPLLQVWHDYKYGNHKWNDSSNWLIYDGTWNHDANTPIMDAQSQDIIKLERAATIVLVSSSHLLSCMLVFPDSLHRMSSQKKKEVKPRRFFLSLDNYRNHINSVK